MEQKINIDNLDDLQKQALVCMYYAMLPKETVIIAAWLHDIASITDYAMYEEHHKYGADIAKEILNELNYDKEKTALV